MRQFRQTRTAYSNILGVRSGRQEQHSQICILAANPYEAGTAHSYILAVKSWREEQCANGLAVISGQTGTVSGYNK